MDQKNINIKGKIKSGILNLGKYLIVISIVLLSLYYFFPDKIAAGLDLSGEYGIEMLTIFPAVLVLMGLADVWIPKAMIEKYLGKEAGIRGIILSIIMGTLPTGPLYIAFPIAAELLRKNARISNVMIFLGVWASSKIPQIGVEIKFLGFKFAMLRLIFTLAALIVIGYLIEYIINKKEKSEAAS
ncbi:MAG: permease [Halanaerobiales bacterium]